VAGAGIPDVLANPVGTAVALITGAEPGLGREAAEQAVTAVARGRAVRRRLAAALAARPEILADGRSPAPRVAGDLLLALRKVGATVISPPVCAGCSRQLRTLSRLGQDWYCGGCASRPGRCSACGRETLIKSRDRAGGPRCARCPDRDDRDPLAVLSAAVTAADPSLSGDTVTTAAQRVFTKSFNLRKLAWAIEGDPGLLTGGGNRAPVMGILRLIDELAAAGAENIIRPACGRCGRVVLLYRQVDGLWCCRSCVARTRAQACARCGTVKEPAARHEHGQPICPYCLITDPANQEDCIKCSRRRPVSVRTPGGPLCQNCRPVPVAACSICGREAPCEVSTATGRPWCSRCQQRWAECSSCEKTRPLHGGSLKQPLCLACTRPGASSWNACPCCGEEARIQPGRPCLRCALRRKLDGLLAGSSGEVRPELLAFRDSQARRQPVSGSSRVPGPTLRSDHPKTGEAAPCRTQPHPPCRLGMSIAAVGLLRAGGRRSPRSVQSRHLHGQNPPSSLSAISNPSTLWWPATAIPRRHRDRLGAPQWFADAVQCWGTS
jgi:hypothetical protein